MSKDTQITDKPGYFREDTGYAIYGKQNRISHILYTSPTEIWEIEVQSAGIPLEHITSVFRLGFYEGKQEERFTIMPDIPTNASDYALIQIHILAKTHVLCEVYAPLQVRVNTRKKIIQIWLWCDVEIDDEEVRIISVFPS